MSLRSTQLANKGEGRVYEVYAAPQLANKGEGRVYDRSFYAQLCNRSSLHVQSNIHTQLLIVPAGSRWKAYQVHSFL